ncbi:sensor histidine kinase [Kribbella speibonae]|uniref:histidine kinase n=1 Tax=Kribbella speibonae TaxID=1572660 RepID=A0ABY2ACX3_9ACTN|nr:ATP-binding protein [Kribbella speibonae]TCC26832.1 histidine kinase [Kribbella speibonae]
MPERLPCQKTELRTLFLFEKLDDAQLDWLCRNGYVEHFEPGFIYREDDLATSFYVLLEGELAISRRAGNEDVEINRTSQVGAYAGAWRSFFGDEVSRTLDNTLRATRPSRMYVLAADKFAAAMREWFPMPLHLLEGLFLGMKNTQRAISQRERLVALGSLSAGLMHELNNPTAAAMRATATVRERVAGLRRSLATRALSNLDDATWASLATIQEEALDRMQQGTSWAPLEVADREDELIDWFETRGIADGWRMAPTFVQAGLDADWLDTIAHMVGDQATLGSVLEWLHHTIDLESSMNEIDDTTGRISTLVTAAQQYTQLDRTPYREVDVHQLLDSTLVMLTHKIGDGVTVVREFDRDLPAIPVHAAELNQVWTNLITNAVDAMHGHGTLTVRSSRDNDRLLVEIGDTGPGVPDEIKDRIFEPFFTTKPVGAGTGLGLDISWRIVVDKHHGALSVESSPGSTRFLVHLPLVAPSEPEPT